jgi:hypothetical protein
VQDDLSCIVTSLSVAAGAGDATLQVQSGSGMGFAPEMLAYVAAPGNVSGEFLMIRDVDATSLTFTAGVSQAYPLGSSVYAIDERIYAIDASIPALPLLMLTVNRGLPQAFAAGISDLQIEYVLQENCPTCTRVDLPNSNAQWRLVNSIDLTATVDTVGAIRPEDQATFVAVSTAKPRNLLP